MRQTATKPLQGTAGQRPSKRSAPLTGPLYGDVTQVRRPFKYRQRSPFHVLGRLARYEFENIDRFLEWANQQARARQRFLERLPGRIGTDDCFVDDVAEIEGFTSLCNESAIVMLWRCIELSRRRLIANALGARMARGVFRHANFCQALSMVRISEAKLRCARSVEELRCLNNAVKHEGLVGAELATHARWKGRLGQELGNLRPHFDRLRPLAERYINNLVKKAAR